MMVTIFQKLDSWVEQKNQENLRDGSLPMPLFFIKILGQMALIEAKLDLNLAATQDLDVFTDCEHCVKTKLAELLKSYGKHLDALSHEIWMPKETEYQQIFKGKTFAGFIAKTEYVLISKALKAPKKNDALITEYLAKGASSLFLKLAEQYQIDLESFVQ